MGETTDGEFPLSDVKLGSPLAPPRLTDDQAVAVARNDHWAESLFTHPCTVEYGSYSSRLVIGDEPVGTIDVWRITITGVFIPRPGGRSGASSRPPPVTTLIIYVDDKAGTVLEACGY